MASQFPRSNLRHIAVVFVSRWPSSFCEIWFISCHYFQLQKCCWHYLVLVSINCGNDMLVIVYLLDVFFLNYCGHFDLGNCGIDHFGHGWILFWARPGICWVYYVSKYWLTSMALLFCIIFVVFRYFIFVSHYHTSHTLRRLYNARRYIVYHWNIHQQ